MKMYEGCVRYAKNKKEKWWESSYAAFVGKKRMGMEWSIPSRHNGAKGGKERMTNMPPFFFLSLHHNHRKRTSSLHPNPFPRFPLLPLLPLWTERKYKDGLVWKRLILVLNRHGSRTYSMQGYVIALVFLLACRRAQSRIDNEELVAHVGYLFRAGLTASATRGR
ncbi:uncharacterized protein G2W53_043483 [Senna tora]|uniref:Uncharacterized protein n=1 Tax=Senna tora TaxID=362788 RepID=A0A834SIV0_9FABA|nr:uncharacterized protein G2W53_043483 [Senna tora]